MRILCLGISAVLIIIDQLIKLWADISLMPAGTMPFIPGLFDLTYVENYGAAFSILQNKQLFLIITTSAVMIAAIIFVFVKRVSDKLLLSSFTLIIAGGIGNLIDRIARGYVIDYLEFLPFNFPIFNFADCCVVIGTGLFILYVMISEIRESKEAKKVKGE